MRRFDFLKRNETPSPDDRRKLPSSKQLKEFSDLMNMMCEGGCETDELPNATGEFGYAQTNPIPTNTILGTTIYLSRLRATDGTPILTTRVGSLTVDVSPHPIDAYEVTDSNGQPLGTLHVSPYQKRNSEKAPKGFTLVATTDPDTLAAGEGPVKGPTLSAIEGLPLNATQEDDCSALEYADLLQSEALQHWPPVRTQEEAETMVRNYLAKATNLPRMLTEQEIKLFGSFVLRQFEKPSQRGVANPQILNMVEMVRETLPPSEKAVVAHIPVVDLMHPSLNAYAIKTPSGQPLITLNFGAPLALTKFTLALHNAIMHRDDKNIREAELVYVLAWSLYLVTLEPRFLRVQPVGRMETEEVKKRNEDRILDLQIQFILAHEYYHHICGHLETASTTNAVCRLGTDVRVDYYTADQECEFEADRRAFEYMQDHWSGTMHGIIYLYLILGAVDRFFTLDYLIESLVRRLQGCGPSLTPPPEHPPAKDRRERIRQMSAKRGFAVQEASVFADAFVEEALERSGELLQQIESSPQSLEQLALWLQCKSALSKGVEQRGDRPNYY